MEEDINPKDEESLAGDEDVESSDGEGSDSSSEESGEIKDVLGEALGKEFKDNDSAIKAVKDTFSYVGKKGQEVKSLQEELAKAKGGSSDDNTQKIESLEKSLRDSQFYADNPEYKPHKDLISKFGNNPEEVIADDGFKEVYGKVKAQDESEKSKSVLQSNPRLGQVTDKMSKARESVKEGNQIAANEAATDAVIDAYEL